MSWWHCSKNGTVHYGDSLSTFTLLTIWSTPLIPCPFPLFTSQSLFYASLIFSHTSLHFLDLFFVTLYSFCHVLHIFFPFVSFLGVHNHLFPSLYLMNLLPLPCFFFTTIYLQFSRREFTLTPFFSLYNANSFFAYSIFLKIFQISSFCSVPSFLFLIPVPCIALTVPSASIPCFLVLISCSVLPETMEDRKVSLNSYPFPMSFLNSFFLFCFLFSFSCFLSFNFLFRPPWDNRGQEG